MTIWGLGRSPNENINMESANRVGGREHGQNLPVRRRRACPPKAGLQEVNNTGGQVCGIYGLQDWRTLSELGFTGLMDCRIERKMR